MPKSRKQNLIKQCAELGLEIPAKPTIAQLEKILQNNRPGEGYVVRLLKPSTRFSNHSVCQLEMGKTYWLPPCKETDEILATKIVLILMRCSSSECPKEIRLLDFSEA